MNYPECLELWEDKGEYTMPLTSLLVLMLLVLGFIVIYGLDIRRNK